MKKALITGIGGFVGNHLTRLLLKKNIRVVGFVHPQHKSNNLDDISDQIEIIECDLLNKRNVQSQLRSIKPDLVFHLAAASSPAKSFADPMSTLKNNIEGQIFLLDALVKIKTNANILIVGSAEEYGDVKKKDLPIDENVPLNPTSPYAVSKVAQDLLGYQYFLHQHLNIIRVRPFNHIGPGQSTDFVVPAFAAQIVGIEQKGKGEIKVGNLNSWRDFTDVRDIIEAYYLALCGKCKFGSVYNIGSGKAVKIADVLQKLISLSSAKIKVIIDEKRFRPIDVEKIYCNASKFRKTTGWKPTISLEKTLSDTIGYERIKAIKES